MAAQQTANQAHEQLNSLIISLRIAENSFEQAKKSSQQAQANAAAQNSMVYQAKLKVEAIVQKLQAALADLEETHKAAQKASSAASIAQANADAAAAAITSLGGHGGDEHHSGEYH